MMFSFVGGRGHAEPLLPIARAAAARGHDIAFAAQSAMVPWLESEGFTAFAAGPATVSSTKQPPIAPDRLHEERVLRDHFAGSIANGRAEDLLPLFCDWRPDVVVCDEVDFGALVVAETIGVSRAVVIVLAAGGFATPALLGGVLNDLRAAHGLGPDQSLAMLDGEVVLAPVLPSFRDPDDPLPATVQYIRPSALEPAAQDLTVSFVPGWPTVYVTLGTIFNLESGDLFERVLDGLGDTLWNVVVTVGPHVDPADFGTRWANVHVAAFIPQAVVLPRCDAVVCHGGSGTVIGALAHGVPVVNIPMGADQLHNADRCEALGVGITLDVMTATPDEIRQAVSAVLTDPAYRRNVGPLGAEAVGLPGADNAIRALERLFDHRS